MTKQTDNEEVKKDGLSKRLHRRSLLKAGAIAAPVALTLHGGVPLAHADSAGLCVLDLQKIANNPNDSRHKMMLVPTAPNGKVTLPNNSFKHSFYKEADHYPEGTKMMPWDSGNYQHWDFLEKNEGHYGWSCINSIKYGQVKPKGNNGWGNGDQSPPGNSGPHNNAENGPKNGGPDAYPGNSGNNGNGVK